jgi:hypothetical protein
MIMYVRAHSHPMYTLGTQWNVNLFTFLIHAHQKYLTPCISQHMQALYTFVQTPSLGMHERGLGTRLDSIYDRTIYVLFLQ